MEGEAQKRGASSFPVNSSAARLRSCRFPLLLTLPSPPSPRRPLEPVRLAYTRWAGVVLYVRHVCESFFFSFFFFFFFLSFNLSRRRVFDPVRQRPVFTAAETPGATYFAPTVRIIINISRSVFNVSTTAAQLFDTAPVLYSGVLFFFGCIRFFFFITPI